MEIKLGNSLHGEKKAITHGDTPEIEIQNNLLCLEWVYLGEGLCGDYNPDDPEDIPLLRFDAYIKDEGQWTPIEDASYCTCVPASTDVEKLIDLLDTIFNKYDEVVDNYIDGESVKRLGEELSHIAA